MAMNLDTFNAWIAALRSGGYPQGTCKLRTEEGSYCCLGVLADVIDPMAWDDHGNWGGRNQGVDHDNVKSGMPLPVSVMAGYIQSSFIVRNDSDGQTFNEIADYAESNKDLLLGKLHEEDGTSEEDKLYEELAQ